MHNLDNTLQQYFGFTTFRPLQKEIITDVLNNRDVFALMPTGGGKSLCYQLPAILKQGVTVVISPLIALMKDQVDGLLQNGIRAAFLNSSLSREEQQALLQRLSRNDVSLLYLAPERLMKEQSIEFLKKLPVSLFAIDEAHCISEWGHDFRPEYRQLRQLRHVFPNIPIIAMTATATQRVKQDILTHLGLHDPRLYLASFNRPNLFYTVSQKDDPIDQILAYIRSHPDTSGIIYCATRDTVEYVAQTLQSYDIRALPYHAGLEDAVRKKHQEQFLYENVPVMVATVAFGMGIDKPNIRFIIHHDLPKSLEQYYQETGRAGRDGLPSDCILLYSPADLRTIEYFVQQKEDENERNIARWQMRQMLQFVEHPDCRRKTLLSYFSERFPEEKCNSCDICVTPQATADGTVPAQKILSCVFRLNQRFGAAYVALVLTGSRSKRILANGHDRLSTFGIIREYTRQQVQACIRELAQLGYLEITADEYPVVRLTAKSSALLKKKDQVFLRSLGKKTLDVHAVATPQEVNHQLFDNLRRLRKKLADTQRIPPYLVFSDATLLDMARYFPQTTEQFSVISGVGNQKLQQYAAPFLNEIIGYCQPRNISSKSIPRMTEKKKRRDGQQRTDGSSQETLRLFQQGLSLAEIAHQRGFVISTIASHLEKAYVDGAAIDLSRLVPEEKQQPIRQAFMKLGTDLLGPVRAALGEQYSYEELRFMRASMMRK